MKKLVLIILSLPILASAQTQEPIDSIESKLLNEVIVEGLTATTSAKATTYMPSSKQKNASQNGYDLLYFMGIPQIQINPMDLSISDNTGGAVSVFINYMPASQQEMLGLYPENVRKVEYLDFPTDPRFQGAPRVINIIVQEYEYGGYTKAKIGTTFLADFTEDANVFSKFSYKKMTYDIFVGQSYNNIHNKLNNALSSEGIFSLKNENGRDFSLTRNENVNDIHARYTDYPFTFRATYNTEKIQIRNTLGFTHSSNPINFQTGTLSFTPGFEENYTYRRSHTTRSNSANYAGTFFFVLPKNFSINATPGFQYSHNNNYLNYFTSGDESIIRNAREDAYKISVDAYLNKQFSQKHLVMLGVRTWDLINRIDYSGNATYTDNYNISQIAGEAAYQLQTQKFNLYTAAGICWEETKINNIKNNTTYPYVHLQFRFSHNSKHSLSLTTQFVNTTPTMVAKSSDILQENEFLYITGNPLLKSSPDVTFTLGYSWIQSNKFNLNAYASYHEMFNRIIREYNPFNDGHALLRKYINNGNFIDGTIGVSANLKLLNNSLQFYISPQMSFYRSTGLYDKRFNPFMFYGHVIYYLNNFYFQAFYKSPDKSMFNNAPATQKYRNLYGLIIGWGNSNWNFRLSAYNVFNKKWDGVDTWISSPLYTEHKVGYGNTAHAKILLSATYTFGYGKKLQQGDEVGAQSGANSAIIKD